MRDSSVAAASASATGLVVDVREVLDLLLSVLDPQLRAVLRGRIPLGRELGWLSGFALQAREERERGRAPAAADQ
ncbi:MAG: hypothetical protein RXS42_06655 [Nitrososphaeria archaeon]